MPTDDAITNEVVSSTKDGWRIAQDPCAIPFPLIDRYEDKSGAMSFVAEKAGEQVVIVVKRVAQAAEYPAIIRGIIEHHAAIKPAVGEIETEVIIDEANGHFELARSGWVSGHRIHGAVVHVDIKGDKIWIQHDGTE